MVQFTLPFASLLLLLVLFTRSSTDARGRSAKGKHPAVKGVKSIFPDSESQYFAASQGKLSGKLPSVKGSKCRLLGHPCQTAVGYLHTYMRPRVVLRMAKDAGGAGDDDDAVAMVKRVLRGSIDARGTIEVDQYFSEVASIWELKTSRRQKLT